MATQVARGEEAVEPADLMRPLLSPWFKLEDGRPAETARKSGFWGSLGQFLFDYNRF